MPIAWQVIVSVECRSPLVWLSVWLVHRRRVVGNGIVGERSALALLRFSYGSGPIMGERWSQRSALVHVQVLDAVAFASAAVLDLHWSDHGRNRDPWLRRNSAGAMCHCIPYSQRRLPEDPLIQRVQRVQRAQSLVSACTFTNLVSFPVHVSPRVSPCHSYDHRCADGPAGQDFMIKSRSASLIGKTARQGKGPAKG